jgi:hypothetical protein
MDWIKKNYDQFLLALAAVALLGVAFLLIQRVKGFDEHFSVAQIPPSPKKNVPPLELTPIDEARKALDTPALWKPAANVAFFMVPKRYIIDPNAKVPMQVSAGSGMDSLTKQAIPNQWFIDNHLDPLNTNITKEDPDKDGFANEDEWRGKTDPNNKESHPPYHTKLFLVSWIKVPFRLLFNATDGDPKKPDKMSFQINTLDLRQPSEFLKLGETVSRTKFKLLKFEHKVIDDPNAGEKDVSELTLENADTKETIVLVKEKITDSPDSFGAFDYQWPQPATQIRVKKLQEFVLLPEKEQKYKLVNIKEGEAEITLPSGQSVTIKPDPRGKH